MKNKQIDLMQMTAAVTRAFCNVLGLNPSSVEVHEEHDLDELDQIEIVMDVEDELNIEIGDDVFDDSLVPTIAAYAQAYMNSILQVHQ